MVTDIAPQKSRIRVPTLIVAQFAAVHGGLLQMIGGGIRLFAPNLNRPYSVAAIVRFPWAEINLEHKVKLELIDPDGNTVELPTGPDSSAGLSFETTVTPSPNRHAKSGDSIDMPFAWLIPPAPMKPGRYEWILWIDGETDEDWHHSVTFLKHPQVQAA